MTVQDKAYLEQIDKYYNKKLKPYCVIEMGMTPDILIKYGASQLPLIMLQSTITKCIRRHTGSRSAHELPRNIIETLPEQIGKPIFIIQDRSRESISIISDAEDKKGNKILIAIRLDTIQNKNRVNEIKSVYGKTSLKEYLQKHIEVNQLNIIDSKKAEMLSRVIGFQLPQALITSSYDRKIAHHSGKVNKEKRQDSDFQGKNKQSIHKKLENFQKKINQGNEKEHHPAQTKQEYENR